MKEKGFAFLRPDDGGSDLFAPLRTFTGDEAGGAELGLVLLFCFFFFFFFFFVGGGLRQMEDIRYDFCLVWGASEANPAFWEPGGTGENMMVLLVVIGSFSSLELLSCFGCSIFMLLSTKKGPRSRFESHF